MSAPCRSRRAYPAQRRSVVWRGSLEEVVEQPVPVNHHHPRRGRAQFDLRTTDAMRAQPRVQTAHTHPSKSKHKDDSRQTDSTQTMRSKTRREKRIDARSLGSVLHFLVFLQQGGSTESESTRGVL